MASSDVDIRLGLDGTKAEKEAATVLGKIGSSASKAGGVIGKTLAAGAAAGTAAIVKSATEAYAAYEQLAGGVDTIFKDSAATVKKYADQAYLTAGMSANQYMDSITSFSASLIQSLGGDTKAAAEMADMAVKDMADNANKMGTSLDSIVQTYQSLARGNYAMLDNLKLGYGGTKAELERLVEDANRYKESMGEVGDLTSDNFADVVEAIHVVQTEMGITGTTAKEASTTIEGSVNSMKAAWENWLTALGRSDVNMGDMTEKLVDSVVTALGNIIPRAVQIIGSLGGVLAKKGPEIAKKLGDSIRDALPNELKGAFDAVSALLTNIALPAAAATVAFSGLSKVFNITTGALSKGKKIISSVADSMLDLATSPKTADTALGKMAGALMSLPGPAKLAAAGVAVLGVAIGALVANQMEQEERQRNMADGMQALSDASRVAGAAATEAADGVEQFNTSAASLQKISDDNWANLAALKDTFADIDKEASQSIGSLTDARTAIELYAGQADLTTAQQGELRAAIESLNSQLGTNYSVAKDAGGTYQIMSDGAAVAKDEVYALIDAQIQQAKVSAQVSKLEELYKVQADQAADYAATLAQVSDAEERVARAKEAAANSKSPWATAELNDAQNDLDNLNASLAEQQSALDATNGSIEAVNESIGNLTEVSTGAATGIEALVKGSGLLGEYFTQTGGDMEDFIADLEATGISLETLSGLTETQLAQVAASWDGTSASVTSALGAMILQVNGYNETPLLNKDGTVNVNDASLVDAQGNIWTWNGTTFVNKEGVAIVDDTSLVDAQGNLWTWNGSQLVSVTATAQVDSDVPQRTDENINYNDNPVENQSADVDISSNAVQRKNENIDFNRNPPKDQSATVTIYKREVNLGGTSSNSNAYQQGSRSVPMMESAARGVALMSEAPLSESASVYAGRAAAPSSEYVASAARYRPAQISSYNNSVAYNYYIGDTKVTTTSDREFAERFVQLMDDMGRLSRT